MVRLPAPTRDTGGFFSSAKRLTLPLGPAFGGDEVRGYPIDMRAKAAGSEWPPPIWPDPPESDFVSVAQFGLGCYERFVAGEGEAWARTALQVGNFLLEQQRPDGSWINQLPLGHTFPLKGPWLCGMAQGEAASLLVRLHLETGEPAFADAARAALAPLARPTDAGGACAYLDGMPWPEEYPTTPASFVLNGAIFAWWGMRDVGLGLGDRPALDAFEVGADTLAANLWRFDTGSWSLYSLYPHPVKGVASSFYHLLHIAQLDAMIALSPRPEFGEMRARWAGYYESRQLRWRAFARKSLFRIVIPRNRVLGQRLPWAR